MAKREPTGMLQQNLSVAETIDATITTIAIRRSDLPQAESRTKNENLDAIYVCTLSINSQKRKNLGRVSAKHNKS